MRSLVALITASLVAGCALFDPPAPPSARLRVGGVPFHAQDGFACGPAAMAMALGWTGVKVEPTALAGPFLTAPRPSAALMETARRYGRFAYPIKGTRALTDELRAGHPVVFLQNLGVEREPLWNCGVVIGYDKAADEFLLHAGSNPDKRMTRRLFERLWSESDEWGLVVLKAGEMPATAEPKTFLQAADELEQAGRHWEAVLSFDSALARWPDSDAALMGLGTSLYRLGDRKGAVEAWQAASKLAPDPTPALAAIEQAKGKQPD